MEPESTVEETLLRCMWASATIAESMPAMAQRSRTAFMAADVAEGALLKAGITVVREGARRVDP